MAICDGTCEPACFACRLRQKAIHVSNEAIPNRLNNQRRVPPRTADPAWERGYVTERRPGGTVMPMLVPGTTRPMRVKQYAEGRQGFEEQRRRLRSDHTIFTKE